jgi:hypothetical protein
MKAVAALSFLLLAAFAGCARHSASEPSASPAITNKADCQAAGGEWHSITGRCDDVHRR